MKRIFALVLSLVFLLSCLVLPAGAIPEVREFLSGLDLRQKMPPVFQK